MAYENQTFLYFLPFWLWTKVFNLFLSVSTSVNAKINTFQKLRKLHYQPKNENKYKMYMKNNMYLIINTSYILWIAILCPS